MLTQAKKGDNELMKHANSNWVTNEDKTVLYLDRYLFFYEDEAKPLEKITKSEIYDAIVDFLNETPWAFYTMLSPETFAFLKDAAHGKAPSFDDHDPRFLQDDFRILRDFFVLSEKAELNSDYQPLIAKMETENQDQLAAVLARLNLLKGLLDLYGYIDNLTLLGKYKDALQLAITMSDLKTLSGCTLTAYYYKQGTKYTYATLLDKPTFRKNFLKSRALFPSLEYQNFSEEEILDYANRFSFSSWRKDAQKLYLRVWDTNHIFAEDEAPYRTRYEKESKDPEELKLYNRVNQAVPKWALKGHSLNEIVKEKLSDSQKIVPIDEKDIGPEIFFPFKDTIVGVYNLAKEHLALSGDVATGEIPWENLEKIKAEFYAHREDYIKTYVDSLGRTLTPYEKETIEGLRHAITSRFIFHSLTHDGAVMVDTADGKRYFVHPLGMGFSEMLQGGYYDEIVSTTILPFEDYITYDSYISGSTIVVSMNHPEALEEGRLIRSIKDFAILA
jgi:hypothetical protein